MKVVASRFDCETAISKMPVRAEISTGTVMFMHCLAAAELASTASEAIEIVCMISGICVSNEDTQKQCEKESSNDDEKPWRRPWRA